MKIEIVEGDNAILFGIDFIVITFDETCVE